VSQEKVGRGGKRKQIKVVIDTNTLISSMIGKEGKPANIVEILSRKDISNYISKEIIDEVKDVIDREKIREITTEQERQHLIHIIETLSVFVKPEVKVDAIKDDPEDNKIIECAISGIISGDTHLLNLKRYYWISTIQKCNANK
jgi:hypothetical protein